MIFHLLAISILRKPRSLYLYNSENVSLSYSIISYKVSRVTVRLCQKPRLKKKPLHNRGTKYAYRHA